MRCQSVQALWPCSPPLHHVVASAVLNDPLALYTGGSDGAIVWWKLSSSVGGRQEIWPMAMLCGHAAAVADLEICTPGKEYDTTHSSTDKSLVSEAREALVSACVDGVLCTWSSLSGRCRRRRKMPPWVGSPSILSSLRSSRRYVCIACTCANTGQTQNSHGGEIIEARKTGKSTNEATLEREENLKRMSKGAVVIVDSLTLNILQVIFHGFLSVGPVKSMVIVQDLMSGNKRESVTVSDLFGRVQSFAINEENNSAGEDGSDLEKSNQLHAVCVDSTDVILDRVEDVSIASDGKLLLLVFRNRWVIKSTIDGTVLVDESCVDSLLCTKHTSGKSFLAGGMFLNKDGCDCDELKFRNADDNKSKNFAIWNNHGAAIIYSILHSEHSSHAISLFHIPPISFLHEGRICVKFKQMHDYLIRIESERSDFEPTVFRETHITIWSPSHVPSRVPQDKADLDAQSEIRTYNGNLDEHCAAILVGKGDFWGNWMKTSYGEKKINDLKGKPKPSKDKKVEAGDYPEYLRCMGMNTTSVNCLKENDALLVEKNKIVTSAMMLSGSSSVPFALVYGFSGGEIKVVKLEIFGPDPYAGEAKVQHKNYPCIASRSFTGHTSPILCLAAHNMLATPKERGSRQVLVSGSMDCTVRVWDLEAGDVLAVMHQHVAPVRQILLPPSWTERPWADCFLTVGDDSCVALSSFETLKVERMFPGHPSYPKMVAWDGMRGYIACLCMQLTGHSGHNDVLYIWDIKSGACERILRGSATHAMFDYFLRCIRTNTTASKIPGGSTSASSLLFQFDEDSDHSHAGTLKLNAGGHPVPSDSKSLGSNSRSAESASLIGKKSGGNLEKLSSKVVQALGQGVKSTSAISSLGDSISTSYLNQSSSPCVLQNKQQPIKGLCPFPSVAALQFDLLALMAPDLGHVSACGKLEKKHQQPGSSEADLCRSNIGNQSPRNGSGNTAQKDSVAAITDSTHHSNWPEENAWLGTIEGHLLRLSLSFLHIWGADDQLDKLLGEEMGISKPEHLGVAAGLPGDRGSLTLFLPGWQATFELWKSSSEFCAMRSLTMVSLAQRIITLSRPSSSASSALAAFYTRSFAEKFPDLIPPSLELYACFWQHPSEPVRMASRSLFHCAASRAIPSVLCHKSSLLPTVSFIYSNDTEKHLVFKDRELSSTDDSDSKLDKNRAQESQLELSEISGWLDSYEAQDWTSMIGGTSQDARASRIIVGAALAVWYPSLVKSNLTVAVAPQLVKLVMAVNDRHSATAAELLAEGMESTWQSQIASEIPHLIGDVFLLIECLSGGASTNTGSIQNPVMAMSIRETLTGILLPSLAMTDVMGFLHVVENQIWTTGSDSPVHLVSLMTLVRIIRGAPKAMVPYLDKATNYILQTMDTGNSVMRKRCLQSSMAALREMVRVFPMVALNQSSAKLAVGDAIGDIRTLTIQVYDLQSVTKLKVLDASGPPGLPSLLAGDMAMTTTGGISALTFSPDGEVLPFFFKIVGMSSVGLVGSTHDNEGLVAFSQHGLMIRWWSLGAAWWEKLSRSTVPIQCTKLILVPPWAGFSPNSSRSSIMASILGGNSPDETQNHDKERADEGCMKVSPQSLDLTYRLEWKPGKKVVLLQHGQELGTFQL